MFDIVLGVALVIFGWMELAYAKLMRFKKEARGKWGKMDTMLKARGEALLELLETLDQMGVHEPEMVEIYGMEGGYRPSPDREDITQLAEDVTPYAYSLFEKCREAELLLEQISFIQEMDEEVEKMADSYNQSIYAHNEIIGLKRYRWQNRILHPQILKDFILTRKT